LGYKCNIIGLYALIQTYRAMYKFNICFGGYTPRPPLKGRERDGGAEEEVGKEVGEKKGRREGGREAGGQAGKQGKWATGSEEKREI